MTTPDFDVIVRTVLLALEVSGQSILVARAIDDKLERLTGGQGCLSLLQISIITAIAAAKRVPLNSSAYLIYY